MTIDAIKIARDVGAVVETGLAPVFYSHKQLDDFARAIEQAVIARLASAEVPEQVAARWPSIPGSHQYAGAGHCQPNSFGPNSEDLFTRSQLQQYGAACAAKQLSSEPVAYVNGDELDNLLDDRSAVIQGVKDGWRVVPLYTLAKQEDKQ